jgi:hypothetical protein
MRGVGILLGLVVAGASAVGAAALSPGPKPTLVTAGAGLLGTGVVGLAIEAIDVLVECRRLTTPFGCGRTDGLSKADQLVVALGAGAVFVRMALVPLVADPLRLGGATLTVLTVVTIGVVVGYETAHGRLLDGLRHGVLACGLGGALCVSLAAYHATSVAAVGTFDAVVAGSGLVLPVAFGLFGGVSGVAGWWLADRLAGTDPLA